MPIAVCALMTAPSCNGTALRFEEHQRVLSSARTIAAVQHEGNGWVTGRIEQATEVAYSVRKVYKGGSQRLLPHPVWPRGVEMIRPVGLTVELTIKVGPKTYTAAAVTGHQGRFRFDLDPYRAEALYHENDHPFIHCTLRCGTATATKNVSPQIYYSFVRRSSTSDA